MTMTRFELEDIKAVAEMNCEWQKLKGKTLLISGGTGFIGSFLVNVLLYRNEHYNDNIKIIVCSRSALQNSSYVTYLKHDITKPIEIDNKIDYIVHLASNTHPKQYGDDPVGTITANVFGTYNLLNLAVKNCARFILASSVEIYGEGSGSPMTENYCGYIDCNTARAGYNESKRVSESLCQSFRQQYGVDCVTARFARVFGADRKDDTKAMAQFLSCAINGQDVILKSAGKQRYSYVYVADAVGGLLSVLTSGKTGEAYNISAEDEGKTMGDYAEFIAGLGGKKVLYDICETKSASKATSALLDCAKIKTLGWIPLYSVCTAIKRTFDILQERKA